MDVDASSLSTDPEALQTVRRPAVAVAVSRRRNHLRRTHHMVTWNMDEHGPLEDDVPLPTEGWLKKHVMCSSECHFFPTILSRSSWGASKRFFGFPSCSRAIRPDLIDDLAGPRGVAPRAPQAARGTGADQCSGGFDRFQPGGARVWAE